MAYIPVELNFSTTT